MDCGQRPSAGLPASGANPYRRLAQFRGPDWPTS